MIWSFPHTFLLRHAHSIWRLQELQPDIILIASNSIRNRPFLFQYIKNKQTKPLIGLVRVMCLS